MPFGSITLTAGVNIERTPLLLRAGISRSQLIRFRDSLTQKYGGWAKYYPFAIGGIPRDLHAWQDLNNIKYLAVGTTSQLNVISNGASQDITPQTLTSNFAPNISTTLNSPIVSITDPNITNVTTNDSVLFNVPVSQGGIILSGLYPITTVTGTHSYQITAATNATATTTNPTLTNALTAIGNNTLHFGTTPAWVANGMVVFDITAPAAIPASTTVTGTTGSTVTLNNNVVAPGVANGDSIVISSVPVFTTINGSSNVLVTFIAHGQSVGNTINFPISTTGQGVTISGEYSILTTPSANTFTIAANVQATGSGSFAMNGGEAQLVYIIALGPPPAGSGFGLGGFGAGGFGTGTSTSSQTGTDLAATSWTSDNWGQILVACPKNGGIYYWQPGSGFQTASIIPEAPPYNTAIFISTTEQILIAIGSSVAVGIGVQQQPLLVQWSDVGNFFQWTASDKTQAGNFVIPLGSKLVAGTAVSNQNLLWTDLDLWSMSYIGPPDVFGFNKIGAGMGAASAHAIQQLRGSILWMGTSNFYGYSGGSANVLRCPIWDAVFQNINMAFVQNICSMPNTPFNEAGWFFPSAASSTGENDSYVKMNIFEPNAPWDIGLITQLQRSAWIDQSLLGNPISASSSGIIYQQETTPDADGSPLVSSFTTGDFYLDEGEQFVYVDQIMPDFIWDVFTGGASAQIQLTFNVSNFPGDTPIQYGPYTVTQATEYLGVRFRGRLMSVTVSSSDLGSWWRIGSIKFRYSGSGRR
jgi:hypothetical protein